MSIVVVVVEKQNRFLRFHAFQSLLLAGVCIVISVVLTIVGMVVGAMSSALSMVFSLVHGVVGLAMLGAFWEGGAVPAALAVLTGACGFVLKRAYWKAIDTAPAESTPESATASSARSIPS